MEVGVVDGEGSVDLDGCSRVRSTSRSACSRLPASTVRRSRFDRVERGGELGGPRRIVREQAFDAERHVGQPAGGIEPWPDGEAEVGGARQARVAAGGGEEGRHAGLHPAGANPLQALCHQAAVVAVEADDVGDRAEGDEVEQRVQSRLLRDRELAALAQLGAQRQQHVERDADAGELLAREAAARLARIDDDVGRGQPHLAVDDRRQVVVGDHHREAVRGRMGDAFEAGDAVVDREQHVRRLALEGEVDDRRRQAVAVDAPVGHDVGERRRVGAEQGQAAQGDGAGGGAVAVVVGDDADPAAGADRVGEQLRGRRRAEQARRAAAAATGRRPARRPP